MSRSLEIEKDHSASRELRSCSFGVWSGKESHVDVVKPQIFLTWTAVEAT